MKTSMTRTALSSALHSSDVWQLVCRELGDKRETRHGWNFGDRLADPPAQREYKDIDGSTSIYWVVLVESEDGYHIVFDEDDCHFGLATSGIVVGWYGDLMTTIEGM